MEPAVHRGSIIPCKNG